MKTALTIAGSDCSGGAGIQADLKTMCSLGVYGMSVINALTAQNTTGVYGIMNVTSEFCELQLDSIFQDIYPDAIKIGMVSSSDLILSIVKKLKEYDAKNIVVDPVMVATSGAKLISDDAIETLQKELIPIASLITPNIPEAEVISGMKISDKKTMEEAAQLIYQKSKVNVLVKGGHLIEEAQDCLYDGHEYHWFVSKRIDNPNTHGTGCTLSSAIASYLALGYPLVEAIENAKAYLTGALAYGLDLGKGSGPLNHSYKVMK
ncbi:MAG: bifunctional hydroxymethylpyrimidine kinase/phosphomethylpyrimidine kinase [Erysipelotrichaceae bacterium]|nr:bifunctional hydroxymethylpyrimidine kinase/phosphomethylpyrimidine kinase [Erysipelotrichaceae bacterium]